MDDGGDQLIFVRKIVGTLNALQILMNGTPKKRDSSEPRLAIQHKCCPGDSGQGEDSFTDMVKIMRLERSN